VRNLGHWVRFRGNRTENLHEQMDSFEISKFVVVSVYTDAEKQAGISPVDNFVVPELVSRLAFTSERSQEGTPQRNSIDAFGLVGQLSGELPHVAVPTGEG